MITSTTELRATLIALVISAKAMLTKEQFVQSMRNATTAHHSKEGDPPTLATLLNITEEECDLMSSLFNNKRDILMDERAPKNFRLMYLDGAPDDDLADIIRWHEFIAPFIPSEEEA